MGKWAKYKKKHSFEWEKDPKFRGWLSANPSGDGSSYCKLCRTALRSHKGDLEKHSTTMKHKSALSQLDKSQQNIKKYATATTNSSKKKEIILASYIATHTSIRSVDHITDIINDFMKNQKSQASTSFGDQDKLQLHRTKCSALIKRVISPSLMSDLINDVKGKPFSLIVDESTDISTEKLLCINIRYYSESKNDIVTQFLTFLSVVYTTADDLYKEITTFFSSINLDLSNLIGIGTDGASNMCGKHHSLFTLLKAKLKLDNLILVKCVCHSLHLCASKASEIFSDEIDFLIKETYNWFKNSVIRIHQYKEIYDLINNGDKFYKLTQLSNTRWLSRYRAVDKILAQYLELETFFSMISVKERCHTAKLLTDAFKCKENKLVLHFLQPILKQIHQLNLYFQSQNIDHYTAFEDINTTIWSLARQILRPSVVNNLNSNLDLLERAITFESNFLNLDACDLGYEFDVHLKEANLPEEQVNNLKTKCLSFIKILLEQLIQRMPSHLSIFHQIKFFHPKMILSLSERPKFSELPLKFANSEHLGAMEVQYRKILNIRWNDLFESGIPNEPIEFWKKVITLKNAMGEFMFRELALFAFKMLSIPSSNAVVERSFSIMNIVKNKLRNKMLLNLLNAIMTIKFHFYTNKICCKDFEPTADMISRFTSKIYENDKDQDGTNDLDNIIDVLELCNTTY